MTESPTGPTGPTGSPAGSPPAGVLDRVLSAEHAAVFAYGVIGGKTSGALLRRATAGFDAHRARRDQLRTLITQRGGTPAEPGPAYHLPFEVRGQADAVRLAVLVEQRVITAYLEMAADPDPGLRRLAALTAQECATRAYGWQPRIDAFPGMNRGGDSATPTQEAGSPAPDPAESDPPPPTPSGP
ncbi:ferritin-like domain-containing protein [Microbispora sp. H11081]|uniref:ferritin-like domain-containing protein n=1 Tax=Microbispora sp. H11081 TaxID=2729107 RepID=UPI001475E61C|nr:ferritin-like domain-containing protein [Microbispora sp. H11081]